MSRKVSVSFDESQVKKMVSRILALDVPNREHLIDYFSSLIFDTYSAAEPFVLLITGSLPEQIYYKGDTVQFNPSSLYLSGVDVQKCDALGHSEGGWLWAKILDFRKHKTDCYQISFSFINGSDEIKESTNWVNPSAIRKDKAIPDKDRMNFGEIL